MKKQIRHIQVKGESYAWQARTHEDEGGLLYTKVKIWDAVKTLIHEIELLCEKPVTPGMIADFLGHDHKKISFYNQNENTL